VYHKIKTNLNTIVFLPGMDYFAHGFWSYILFHTTKKPYLAVLIGLLPDSLSWGIYFIYNLFNGGMPGKPNLALVPDWVYTLYGISHSLITWGLLILCIYIIFKNVPIYLYAAPIAILFDIPTHTREFLPTPFLWPISDWAFPGISWGSKWFMITNYSLIILCLAYIFWKKYQKPSS